MSSRVKNCSSLRGARATWGCRSRAVDRVDVPLFLATTFIPAADTARLQQNLLMSHAVGVGDALPDDVVRAMLLLRANTLALGHSGCRPVIVERLLELVAAGIHPVVPEMGSVGASGDLAPLAHLALPLIGRGEASRAVGIRGPSCRPCGSRHRAARPRGEEGLALLNGTQLMTAIGALLPPMPTACCAPRASPRR